MHHDSFDAYADRYDAWYDTEVGKSILAMEVDCLKPLLWQYSRPYLEIGVGSGRFAQALGVEYGVDPSAMLLSKAKSRSIRVLKSVGEKLPFADEMFGGVLIAFSLCFMDDPASVFQEARRVLRTKGGLILGLILKGSPWAEFYTSKGEEGHPIYSRAYFFSKDEVEDLLLSSGFKALDYRSTLFQLPEQASYHPESPVTGYFTSAGFTAVSSLKRTA